MIRMTEEEFEELQESHGGVCRSCGAHVFGVEPDARFYHCEDCEADDVFGAEELLLMGEIQFREEDEELGDFEDAREFEREDIEELFEDDDIDLD